MSFVAHGPLVSVGELLDWSVKLGKNLKSQGISK